MRVLIAVLALLLSGCTQQQRARNFGGSSTVELEPCRELWNVTWKGDSDLWVLTAPASPGWTPKTFEFKEESTFGVMEGVVILNEHPCKVVGL